MKPPGHLGRRKGHAAYRDRAARLLRDVLTEPGFGRERVAETLVVSPAIVDAFQSGRVRMPLERQLSLALLVITEVPRLARAGNRLREHACAAMRYNARETVLHDGPPPGRAWLEGHFRTAVPPPGEV